MPHRHRHRRGGLPQGQPQQLEQPDLGTQDAEEDPGDEGDGDTEQVS